MVVFFFIPRVLSSSAWLVNVQKTSHPPSPFKQDFLKNVHRPPPGMLRRTLSSDSCQFSIHVRLSWISSVHNQTSPWIFLLRFISPCFVSLQLGSPPHLHCHALRAEAWGECGSEPGCIWPPLTGGRGHGSCGWGSSSCLACPFVSLMTWLRKVSCSIQEALRVILPDDGHPPPPPSRAFGWGDVF